jgi:pilus assembly protein CpaC
MTTQIRRRAWAGTTVIILAVFGSMTVYTQTTPPLAASAVSATNAGVEAKAVAGAETEARQVRLLVGRSAIVEPGSPVTRVSLTSADIADVVVTTSSQLLLNGKMAGTTSMFVWDRAGVVRRYEVIVQRDVTRLIEQLKELFPGDTIDVRSNGTKIVLAGRVSSKAVADNAVNLAAGYVDKKDDVVSLLQARENVPSNQVLLRVRFAEVSRSAMTELGAGLFTSPTGVQNTIGRVTTGQFPAPGFDELTASKSSSNFGAPVTSASGKFTFSDFLNLFLFSEKFDLGVALKALQTRGLFQSLAEPNLVAESGKEASFLAGGEFPVPVPQATSSGTTITIAYKEFGVRLNFTPVVNGNRVHLKVRPEVSTLDFANAIVLQGFRIPALSTRRTETELELENGQTFAIAGLINNSMVNSMQKMPGIGDIPILGLLFRSKSAQKDQTELVVMITPVILPVGSSGVTPSLPRLSEPFLPPLPPKESLQAPPPAFAAPSAAVTPPAAPAVRTAAAAPAKETPASAAAAVSALNPNTRTIVREAPKPAAAAPAGAPIAAPVPAATPVAAASVSRPLTAAEQKRVDRARKQEQERAKRDADAAFKLQQEQTKRDADAALKLQNEQAKRDADDAAKAAKKQAEIDRKRQKALSDAAKNGK